MRFLPYRSAIPTVVLFDPSLLGLFGFVAYSFLNDSVWSFGLFDYVACELLCPIILLGILGPFTLLGSFRFFFLTLHSHRFLLTPLGFPDPITLSLILGAYGLAINPLLSLLTLLWTCCGPFSLFYITYCPWVCHFSLFGLL